MPVGREAVYRELAERARARGPGDADVRMRLVVDLIWDHLGSATTPGMPHAPGRPYSWIGFYTLDDQQMVLGASRNKPACSPIGLHGACGRCARERRILLIDDVATLGDGYVACDPNDVSEIVVPCFRDDGRAYGVLDGDSFDRAAFDESDAAGLVALLEAAGLTPPGSVPPEPVRA